MNGQSLATAEKGGPWSKLSARALADRNLTATDVCVLGVIAVYANRDGIAWQSQDTIASILSITREKTNRAVKRLRVGGYLVRYRQPTLKAIKTCLSLGRYQPSRQSSP